ncbi:perlucin-like protein [Acanthaster planci]|uniref:Perlucin-like protein n=1 Tax=Acanthaster planci TaxID=133434 RepID=A0A8B7YDU6_ACAPL|nr:perlucin-like protein [Acanthaster planci]
MKKIYRVIAAVILSSVVTAVVGTDTCSSSATAACPPSWQPWGNSCYRFTEEKANWNQSKLACQTMGGKMAVPYSREENEFMIKMAQRGNIPLFWIGCTNTKGEGTWVCEGQGAGEPFFDWMPNRPNKNHKKIKCFIANTTYKGTGDQNDIRCCRRKRALCTFPPCTQAHHYCFATDNSRQLLKNSCLLNHVIREFMTRSNLKCASACIQEPVCRSFNIRHNDTGQKVCQLNNATRRDDPAQFQDVASFCLYAHECGN